MGPIYLNRLRMANPKVLAHDKHIMNSPWWLTDSQYLDEVLLCVLTVMIADTKTALLEKPMH